MFCRVPFPVTFSHCTLGLATVAVLFLAMPLLSACDAEEARGTLAVRISDARLRALIPGQDKTAAYFDIRNDGDEELTLIGADTAGARAVEIHEIIRDGDTVRMRRRSSVAIPAGQTVHFAPGGLHLMVFGVSSTTAGAEIFLITEDGQRVGARFREMALGAQQ